MDLTPDDLETETYQLALGKVIHAWAEMEAVLSEWFAELTNLHFQVADDLFFSGRNFGTRCDLVRAAMKHTRVKEADLLLVKAFVAVAQRYSGFRNTVAHDQHVRFYGRGFRTLPGDDKFAAFADGRAYTIDDINQAYLNIKMLTKLAYGSVWEMPVEGWEESAREQILRLPKLAHQSEPTPIAPERRSRRNQSSRTVHFPR